ncbi:MAG: NAD-dependent dehydratase [Candidatus Pacebacteria bacterium CG10_big_fil_rev_8_21_14_0_10_56_10]|nr:MAG: NAD-dependent dehydratase [Candidatus Pacebacteria bacterium CG10_big_fil_rev_8_21_14_0_10_56_10]
MVSSRIGTVTDQTAPQLAEYNEATVVVTGGAGFVGSHLCQRLLKLGANVIAIDNLLTGTIDNLDQVRRAVTGQAEKLQFIKADVISAPETYLTSTDRLNFIFHLASPASPYWYQRYPVETYLANSLATHQLGSFLLSRYPQAILIFASTSEVYGNPQQHPQSEEYWGNVNPNGPRSCYDESKRLGETICGVLHRDFGLDTRIARIFNTYGPRLNRRDGRVIVEFVTQALERQPLSIFGDGRQTRSFCYVSDLVEYLVRLGAVGELAGQTLNIGNPDEHTVADTADTIWRMINPGSEPRWRHQPLPIDDPLRRQPDIAQARRLLNWSPQVSFQQGLAETISYYRAASA